MNARLFLIGFVLVSLICSPRGWAERPIDVDAAVEQLRRLQADIQFLASDQLRGRSVADETIDQAADYIVDRMTKLGLDMTAVDGSSLQAVSVTLGARPGSADNNRVTIQPQDEAIAPLTAKLSDGMNPMAVGSGSGEVSGRIVFVGYGITAPKLNYDDYQGIDAAGATVIILRKEPRASDPDSPFAGTRNTRHAFFATKIDNAIKHGAAAAILLNDPGSVRQSVLNARNKIDRELERKQSIKTQIANLPVEAVNNRKTLSAKMAGIDSMVASLHDDLKLAQRGILGVSEAGERPAGKDSIPVVSLARDLADKLVRQVANRSLTDVEEQIDATTAPQSFSFPGAIAKIEVELKPTLAKTKNVIGVLPGRGPLANETVVVGAHYDHVGMGGYGSLAPGTIAVHNGADDNASGTAALLAIAGEVRRQLLGTGNHRRIAFVAFTGEERGLVGSKHYVRSPLFPLETTVAMINLDMVGRLRDNELTVYGTGSGDLLDEIVEQANVRQQFKLFKVQTGYGPSDHQSFYEAGVPVLFFFTGLHNDYHRPTDDFDKIDFGGLTRITDTVSEVTYELAIRPERPKYAETENRVRIRRQMTAFIGVTLSDRSDHVAISGLADGGPAQRGGLRVGDRLDKLGGRQMKTATDVLELMRTRSPGDELSVSVIRRGKVIERKIRLAPRPEG